MLSLLIHPCWSGPSSLVLVKTLNFLVASAGQSSGQVSSQVGNHHSWWGKSVMISVTWSPSCFHPTPPPALTLASWASLNLKVLCIITYVPDFLTWIASSQGFQALHRLFLCLWATYDSRKCVYSESLWGSRFRLSFSKEQGSFFLN